MRTIAKVDKNHKQIVQTFRQMGAVVINTHQLKNAFDCLVFFQCKIFAVEIKDGSQPPSKRRLSEGEAKCRTAIESTGNQYHIIESVDQAIELLK